MEKQRQLKLESSFADDNSIVGDGAELASTTQFNYHLLTGHQRTDGSYKSDEQLRTEYIQLTDELIREMTEGVETTDHETEEKSTVRPDYIVWLDKSARPLAWLTKELWPKLASNQAAPDEAPEMPPFRFVNIDREQWVNTVDPQGTGLMDIDRVDKSIIRSLRSVFVEPKYKEGGITEAIDRAPAELDHKTVLIVDEVRSSGKTLSIANKFFEQAFPTAKIATTYWMRGIVKKKDGSTGNADLPVWYKEDTELGRGVGDRDDRLSQRSPSATQRLGRYFLSTRLPEIDKTSLQLRSELKALAHDPNVLVLPSYKREDYETRAEALNNMSLDEINAQKIAMEEAAKVAK